MSNKVFGKKSKFEDGGVSILGKKPMTRCVDPTKIRSFKNRQTKQEKIDEYLESGGGGKKGGFNYNLWKNPSIAVLNGKELLFDGDHRRHMWNQCIYQETGEPMPADFYEVQSEEEIHELFVAVNKKNRSDISAEEEFFHRCGAQEREALAIARDISNAGLKVSLGTGEKGTTIGEENSPSIKIKGFEKALARSSSDAVYRASELMQLAWPRAKTIRPEMLGAIAVVYEHTDFLLEGPKKHPKGGVRDRWEEWFQAGVQGFWGTQYNATTKFKEMGCKEVTNNVHTERSIYAIALGILIATKQANKFDPSSFRKKFKSARDMFKASLEKKDK
jgi:hypothetical protein|tara:strand:+ start:27484 stop:28479 length:996 start_codon:yes stop_codon:yes gene_type:complete